MGNTALKKHYATAEKTGVLNISKSKLQEFPPDLLNLKSVLRNLDLSCNRLHALPCEVGSFSVLKSLSLDQNALSSLPQEIGQLIKLETLSVSGNRLKSLPESLSRLANLKNVNLSTNDLTTFPSMLFGLKHLDVLDLSCNKLKEVPPGVSALYATELNLNMNQVSELAEDIADCPRLKTLRLQENCLQLTSLPARLLSESKVSMLSIEGNLFEMKSFMNMDGYEKYMDRYTAVKKKLF